MKKINKNWIVFFGIIDLLKVEKLTDLIIKLLKGKYSLDYLHVFGIIFTGLIVITGYLLIKNKKLGYYLSYIEFPIRLLFSYMSFSFLIWLNVWIQPSSMIIWTIILFVLEILRLIITILIHRQNGKLPGHNTQYT